MHSRTQQLTSKDIGAPTLAQSSVFSMIASPRGELALQPGEITREEQQDRYARYRQQGLTPRQIALLANPKRARPNR